MPQPESRAPPNIQIGFNWSSLSKVRHGIDELAHAHQLEREIILHARRSSG